MASQTSPHPLSRQASSSNGGHRLRLRGDAMPLGSAPLPWDKAAEKGAVGEIAGEISARVLGLLRGPTGGGATNAKTIISSDLVLVTLSDCLTTAETKVVAAGQADLVTRARGGLYDGIRDEATAIVEELTDRQVVAYLTAQHDDPELAILVFYLAAAPLRLA